MQYARQANQQEQQGQDVVDRDETSLPPYEPRSLCAEEVREKMRPHVERCKPVEQRRGPVGIGHEVFRAGKRKVGRRASGKLLEQHRHAAVVVTDHPGDNIRSHGRHEDPLRHGHPTDTAQAAEVHVYSHNSEREEAAQPKGDPPLGCHTQDVTSPHHLNCDVGDQAGDRNDCRKTTERTRLKGVPEELSLRDQSAALPGFPYPRTEPEGEEGDEGPNGKKHGEAVLVCPPGLSQKGDRAVDLADAHEKDQKKTEVAPTDDMIRGGVDTSASRLHPQVEAQGEECKNHDRHDGPVLKHGSLQVAKCNRQEDEDAQIQHEHVEREKRETQHEGVNAIHDWKYRPD